MKKICSTQRYQAEKAIIDALLKISEIVKKTQISRQSHMLTYKNPRTKKTVGDGNTKQYENDYHEIYDGPVPPPMRRLDSYVSGFNQQYAMPSSSQRASNCNRAPILLNKRCDQSVKKRRVRYDDRYQEPIRKHHRYDISSTSSVSNNRHRHKSSRSNKKQRSIRHIECECQTANDYNEYSASDC